MHCHSTASELAKLGIQRSVGLPECATPPEEVYELAKSRGMDFVTITDHDTIAGCLELADRPDVFISEELTAWFADEPQAVHVLCYGITPEDHEFLQAHARDLETCAAYLHEHEITCALAHPFFHVAAPLTAPAPPPPRAALPVWEIRNGSRARELNMPAAVYIETHGGTGIGGSDDHAGVDIGRTYTETAPASSPEEFLAHVREGRAAAAGSQGSAAKWAHAALALATRSLIDGDAGRGPDARPEAAAESRPRSSRSPSGSSPTAASAAARPQANLGAGEATALLRAWLDSVGLPADPRELIELMKADDFSHSDLFRRAKRIHERKLRDAVERGRGRRRARRRLRRGGAGPVRGRDPGDPVRARDDDPRQREGEALDPRGRAAPGRAGRGRGRLDARREPHGRADPRARRARLRRRGDRHRLARSTAGCRRSPRSRSRSTPGCRSASRASPSWSRRSPRAATTWSISPRPGPPGSARR